MAEPQGDRQLEATADAPPAADTAVRAPVSSHDELPPEPPAELPTPVKLLSHPYPLPNVPGFDILSELARGGMGVVYKARQRSLNRVVALKMIRAGELAEEHERARFRMEAEAVARLQHPNVVQIHEIGEHEGRPYLCLEFVGGGSLDRRFAGKPQPPREVAALVETLAWAMQAVHQCGIVHRDLKPANILLAEGDPSLSGSGERDSPSAVNRLASIPKITDFGLAKRLIEGQAGLTPTRAIVGTPEYMAPEQAAGDPKVTGPLADVYALGGILYEGLTGRPPFKGEAWMQTVQQVLYTEPTPPSRLLKSVPHDLETICLKCLRKEPGRRYSSSEELAADLQRFLAGQTIRARPIGRLERSLRWLRRRWAGAALLALAAVLVLLLLVVTWRAASTPSPSPVADKPLPSVKEVRRKAADLRRAMTAIVRQAQGSNGWFQFNRNPKAAPNEDVWTHAQVLTGLLADPDTADKEVVALAELMGRPFGPGLRIEVEGFKYGWHAEESYARIDPGLWVAIYLARGLSHPALVNHPDWPRWQAWYAETQAILKNYRPADFRGAWNVVPRQRLRSNALVYPSTLALAALVEARRGNLPWEGSAQRRDELLQKTAGWLGAQFQEGPPDGWRAHVHDELDAVSDGLTLKVYAMLLRAETEAGIPLSPAIQRHVAKHLALCGTRAIDYPSSTIVTRVSFTAPEEQELAHANISVNSQWYPWAVEACTRWLARAEKLGTNDEETAAVKRALAHLLIDIQDAAVIYIGSGQTFRAAETLYGLSAVPPP